MLQAVDYYRAARGHHPRSTNRHHRSDTAILGFDAFALAEELLTQPVQVLVAGEALRGPSLVSDVGENPWPTVAAIGGMCLALVPLLVAASNVIVVQRSDELITGATVRHRVEAAVALYRAGRVEKLLSGDNG